MRLNRTAILVGLQLAAFAAPALAQSGAIRGRVFDSIAVRPIANAEVHAIGADAATPVVAFSDSAGRFVLTGLPAGQYALIFYHEALEDLALARRAVAATVSGDTVDVELATPSARSVFQATCGQNALRDSTRLILGGVVDVESNEPRTGARVEASWLETAIDRGLVSRVRTLTATADARGRFGICGLPQGIVTVRATSGAQSSGALDLDTQDQSVVRMRIALAANDSIRWTAGNDEAAQTDTATVVRGTARLTGVVRDSTGQPLANVRVAVRGGGRSATSDQQGRFELDSVPAGSQLLEWKAIGFTPARRVILARPRETGALELRLDERIVALDPVHVRESAITSGFDARRARGMGYFMTRDEVGRLRPYTFSDVARQVPGLRPRMTPFGMVLRWRDGCAPVVYLNGLRVATGASAFTNALQGNRATIPNEGLEEDVDFLVDPRTITGLEVYPPHSSPAQYGINSCAVVVIWAGIPPR